MKKIIKTYCICLLCAVFTSCNTSNSPTMGNEETAILSEYAVIKLDESYRNKILVSPLLHSLIKNQKTNYVTFLSYSKDTLVLPNTQFDKAMHLNNVMVDFFQDQLKLTGTSPYISLEGGYVIVDWKWRHFHPIAADRIYAISDDLEQDYMSYSPYPNYNNGAISNEKFYLLDKTWSELDNLRNVWSVDVGKLITKPIVRYITIDKLDKYRRDSDNVKITGLQLYDAYKKSKEGTDVCNKFIARGDSLEAIYVETLNKMIKAGDFETFSYK